MHGYKKPKNEWSKKKLKRKFNNYDDEFGYDSHEKDNKKNKRYYRVRDGITNNEYDEDDYK